MLRISPAELKAQMDADAWHVLDVRTDDELALVALPGAMHIPLHELPQRFTELPTDKPIAVLCHHGMRSQSGALFLDRQGFAETYSVDGGIDAYALDIDPSLARY